MGSSELNNLSNILTGKGGGPEEGDPAPQGGAAGGDKASGLNQLSDAAEKIEVKPGSAAPAPSAPGPSQGLSQEQLIVATQPMQFQQPSQPDIPPPVLPDSQQTTGQPVQIGSTTEDPKNLLAAGSLPMGTDPNLLALLGGVPGLNTAMALNMNMENLGLPYTYLGTLAANPEEDGPSGGANRSKGKKQTRRGPMDEMRQLIRILVKVFPHSIAMIGNTDEAGGGNRISEEQIKGYLEKTLGEAPRPTWGVPTGWHGYMAELFSWATGKVVTGEECKRVAKREPGRSWEALESEMETIGVHPKAWPLPLTLEGVQKAEEKPEALPIPAVPAAKRSAEDGGGATAGGGGGGKRSRSAAERDYSRMEEADIWKVINDALNAAATKSGTGSDQNAVVAAKLQAKVKFDEMGGLPAAAGGGLYQYIPVMTGLDQSANMNLLNTFLQSSGVSGGLQFDPTDPNSAAALAAAMALPASAVADAAGDERAAKKARGDGDNGAAGAEEGDLEAAAKTLLSSEARGSLFGAMGGDPSKAGAAAAQLGSLPMQPPPLNVTNFATFSFLQQVQQAEQMQMQAETEQAAKE